MTLKEGDIAPAFSLPASNGENVSLNDDLKFFITFKFSLEISELANDIRENRARSGTRDGWTNSVDFRVN